MERKILITVLFILLVCVPRWGIAADVSKVPALTRGIQAYEQGRYRESYDLLAPLANKDNPLATFYLGYFYGRGLIVERNDHQARKQFIGGIGNFERQWGELYSVPYDLKMAKMFQDGTILDKNPMGAFMIFSELEFHGHPEGTYQRAHAFEVGSPPKQNYKIAIKLYRKAAEMDYAPAMTALARLILFGFGMEPDYDVAMEWAHKAIVLGDKEAELLIKYAQSVNGSYKILGLNLTRLAIETVKKHDPSLLSRAQENYDFVYQALTPNEIRLAEEYFPLYRKLKQIWDKRRKLWFDG